MDKKLFRKLIYTRVDAVLEILGYVFLLGSILIAVAACATGAQIVEKFDKAGNAIKYGSPVSDAGQHVVLQSAVFTGDSFIKSRYVEYAL